MTKQLNSSDALKIVKDNRILQLDIMSSVVKAMNVGTDKESVPSFMFLFPGGYGSRINTFKSRVSELAPKLNRTVAGGAIKLIKNELSDILKQCVDIDEIYEQYKKQLHSSGIDVPVGVNLSQQDCSNVSSTYDFTSDIGCSTNELKQLITNCENSLYNTEGRLRHDLLCEETLVQYEKGIESWASAQYDMICKNETLLKNVMEHFNNISTTSKLASKSDLYFCNHPQFAKDVANDESLCENELHEYLFSIFMQRIDAKYNKYAWLKSKYRARVEHIDKIVELCWRRCKNKLHSWTRSVHLIGSWFKDSGFFNDKSPKLRFFIYMKEVCPPDKEVSEESFSKNCKVEEQDKAEFYPDFNAYAKAYDIDLQKLPA